MTRTLTPPLKLFGGKRYTAPRIVALMPPHLHYVEPFAGGLAVLLAKNPEGVSEVANDLSGELTNFWECLADGLAWGLMQRRLTVTPFSEWTWERAATVEPFDAPVDRAIKFFVRCRQSLAGRMDTFAPLSRTRTRRGMNEQSSAWMGAVDGLAAVHARLRRVAILNRDALHVIAQQDGPDTLFYLDPPYLRSTRTAAAVYAHEMTETDHRSLLDLVKRVKGKVMLSGYPSELYDRELAGWVRHTFDLANHAAGGKGKRRMTETLWCNFDPADNRA